MRCKILRGEMRENYRFFGRNNFSLKHGVSLIKVYSLTVCYGKFNSIDFKYRINAKLFFMPTFNIIIFYHPVIYNNNEDKHQYLKHSK